MNIRRIFAYGAALAAALSFSQHSLAQEGTFSLELNNANLVNGGCRLTYVAINNTGVALDKTSYEVVIFDKDGKVSRFIVLEFGKLTEGKTKVVQFDLPDQPCDNISKLLINDVADCSGAAGPSDVCMKNLKPNTLTDIKFGL